MQQHDLPTIFEIHAHIKGAVHSHYKIKEGSNRDFVDREVDRLCQLYGALKIADAINRNTDTALSNVRGI